MSENNMSENNRSHRDVMLVRSIALSAILLCIVASLTASAKDDKTPAMKFAVVNPGRLISEYAYAKKSAETLLKLQQDAETALKTWATFYLLSAMDQDSLTVLAVKEIRVPNEMTKAEKDQKMILSNKHTAAFNQYNEILKKQVGTLTPKDSSDLELYGKMRADTDARINSKKESATKDIQVKEEEYNKKIDADVRTALNKVAKDKGLSLVFSNQAVLFAETDISDDVVKQLNK